MKTLKKHSGRDLTIFSEMSALAVEHNAINLSQGFPDYEIDASLREFLCKASQMGFHQYAPMAGNPILVENLITFNKNRKFPTNYTKEEITIVPGATYGIYTALTTILELGSEVLVFEPFYDSYIPAIEMNGGIPVFVPLQEDGLPNWVELKQKISEKTRAIIINSPHNPSGKIWAKADIEHLYQIIKETSIYILSDEVYDVLIYDDSTFFSIYHHPELKKRSFCMYSFGKMFHITGWKIGYIVACEELTMAFRRVHQYVTFSTNAPAQMALAWYLEIFDEEKNRKAMMEKRDFFLDHVKQTPFEIQQIAQGGYFQLASFKKCKPEMKDKDFAVWLTKALKVATIPVSAFYHNEKDTGFVRFCFAKKEETVKKAFENLKAL